MARAKSFKTALDRNGASPPPKQTRAERELAKLHVNGSEALRGGTVRPRSFRTVREGGVKYAIGEDKDGNSQWEREEDHAPALTTEAALAPRTKRTVAKKEDLPPSLPAEKTKKRKHPAGAPDEDDDDFGDSIALASSSLLPPSRASQRPGKKHPTRITKKTVDATSGSVRKRHRVHGPDVDDEARRAQSAPTVVNANAVSFTDVVALDADVLAETVQRATQVSFPRKSVGFSENREMLKYLNVLQPLTDDNVTTRVSRAGVVEDNSPAAYVLNDKYAKRLFQSNDPVQAPVFFTSEQPLPLVDGDDRHTYIEQALNWLSDDDEHHAVTTWKGHYNAQGQLMERAESVVSIRERFSTERTAQDLLYPWNIPEIVLPTIADTMPAPFKHPTCNLVRDILRYLQEVIPSDICKPDCEQHGRTAEQCERHLLSIDETLLLQKISRNWLGTIMLAEPGAYTHPHVDTFGFGTYIGCATGEIGVAWTAEIPSSNSPAKEPTPKSRWFYKVLRSGEGIYIDPGRWHLVFRCRGRGHTLGWSTRVLRYRDFLPWLQVVRREVRNALDGRMEDANYVLVWRGLLISADRLLRQGRDKGAVEKFGGMERIDAAIEEVQMIHGLLRQALNVGEPPQLEDED